MAFKVPTTPIPPAIPTTKPFFLITVRSFVRRFGFRQRRFTGRLHRSSSPRLRCRPRPGLRCRRPYARQHFPRQLRFSLWCRPALAYGAAAPVLGSTYHGNAGLAYGAAPALAYGAAAPVLGSTFHGRLAGPAVAYGAPALAAPAITSQSSNILRSFGNLGQVSTYSKSIDTPYSSVRKADIRVSNPGVRIAAAAPALAYGAAPALSTYHGSYASPVLRTAVAAPAISTYHGAALAAPAIATPALGALGVAYSAAPAVSHINYASSYANYAW
jgi:hypothetical protein